jgi:hypothetical protein
MPQVRFEPTIPVFERAKTVHALDRAATVIGVSGNNRLLLWERCETRNWKFVGKLQRILVL